MEIADLVALCYSPNSCYTRVMPVSGIPGLTVDLAGGRWIYEDRSYEIGQMKYSPWGCRDGVIGVYNVREMSDLNSMIAHAKEATRGPGSWLSD